MRTTGSPLSFVLACLTIALLAASGCGGDVSPTAPSIPASGFSAAGNVAVSGTVTTGGGFQSESAVPSAGTAGIRVTVPGTNLATVTSATGGFVLNGVPSGDIWLHFQGTNVNADLGLPSLIDGKTIEVEVEGARLTGGGVLADKVDVLKVE